MSLTAITLLALAASGAAASGVVGRKQPSTFLDRSKAMLTTPALSKYRPEDYTTVESALSSTKKTNKEQSTSDKVFSKLKFGHVLGTFFLAGLPIPKLLSYFNVDEDSFWMKAAKIAMPFEIIGTAVTYLTATFCKNDYVESMKNLVDNYVQKLKVTNGKIEDVITGVDKTGELYHTFDDLIMDDKSQLISMIRDLKRKGAGRNLMGATGIGKTSSVYAAASGILEDPEYKTGSVQIWKANKNILEGTLADSEELGMFTRFLDGMSNVLGLGRLSGETRAERIERLIANAVKHYRETGEYVIILLDEAHELFSKSKRSSSPNSRDSFDVRSLSSAFGVENGNDPLDRSKTAEELGPLFDDKLNTEMCEGVMLIATSNASREDVAYHLLRRLEIIQMKKPDEKNRKEMIERTIRNRFEKGLTSQEIKADNLTVDEIIKAATGDGNLQSIGTMDLFKLYYGENEDQAKTAGFGSHIELLKKRNILHYAHIKNAINTTINNYRSGGIAEFVNILKAELEKALNAELGNRSACLSEVKAFSEFDPDQVQKAAAKKTEEEKDLSLADKNKLAGDIVTIIFDKLKDQIASLLSSSAAA